MSSGLVLPSGTHKSASTKPSSPLAQSTVPTSVPPSTQQSNVANTSSLEKGQQPATTTTDSQPIVIPGVHGIVPTLQSVFTNFISKALSHNLFRNIVSTVNLDCRLDLKTIALHARNAEYNPKVGLVPVT